jgi:hypothetical protein
MDGTQFILGVGGVILFLVWAIAVPHSVMTAREKQEKGKEDSAETEHEKAAPAPAPAATAQEPALPAPTRSHGDVPAVLRKDPKWQAPLATKVPRELIEFPRKVSPRRPSARRTSQAQWLGPLQALQGVAVAAGSPPLVGADKVAHQRRTRDLSPASEAVLATAAAVMPSGTTSVLTGPHPGQHDGFDPMPPWEEELAAFAANSMDERNPFAPI